MAGLRSKELSPIPSPLLTPSPLLLTPKRLTPRLPPIVLERSPCSSPGAPPPSPEPWSWYHRHCHHGLRQAPLRHRLRNTNKISRTHRDLQTFRIFLERNHDLLVSYVAEEVPPQELEDWLRRKRINGANSDTSFEVKSLPSSPQQGRSSPSTSSDVKSASPRNGFSSHSSLELKSTGSTKPVRTNTCSDVKSVRSQSYGCTSNSLEVKSLASSPRSSNTSLDVKPASVTKQNGASNTSLVAKSSTRCWGISLDLKSDSSKRNSISSKTSLKVKSFSSQRPNRSGLRTLEVKSASSSRPNGSNTSLEKSSVSSPVSSQLNGVSANTSLEEVSTRQSSIVPKTTVGINSIPSSSRLYETSPEISVEFSPRSVGASAVDSNNVKHDELEDNLFELCTGYKRREQQLDSSDTDEEVPDKVIHQNLIPDLIVVPAVQKMKQETTVVINGRKTEVQGIPPELELAKSQFSSKSSPESSLSSSALMKWSTWRSESLTSSSVALELLEHHNQPDVSIEKRGVRKSRQLPVLNEDKKHITSIIDEIVLKMFPDASVEMYLIDLQDALFCIAQQSLEHTTSQHERVIRRVVADERPLFLNRHDLSRLSNPPKHMVAYFNKNHYVVFIPLRVHFGSIVIEIWNKSAFDSTGKALIRSLQKIVSITLPYHRQYQSLLQESKISAFLLQVAQAVFEEMISLDQLIKKILEVAQHLVSADRASLFLVDYTNSELVSTVFDLRYEANQDSEFFKEEIRIPINKGIAGHVAMSGETLNIPDAYSDERFNKAVDETTGYHTVSILCMPIKVRGKVIAVVQMVNKRNKNVFGSDDESAFQVFSTFFGLALHHAKLYDKIKRKEQKYKVALEVLGYHNTCSEEDVVKILEERTKGGDINYNDFALNPFEVSDVQKCKSILTMFEDLFDMTRFDLTVLTRFVLTVKKNYRRVPYHNFDHGWAVANSMYVMLKTDTESRFDFNDRLSLFVACLCHDLDHRGYTNKFMSEIDSPLAAIYTTSTLEHHHFNMTVTILQQDGHNIFYQMSSAEYKSVLDSIRRCILATDLAAFFPNLKKINELMFETPQFDWNDVNHSALAGSFCMTGADLSASAKPFNTQLKTVEIIFDEFYQQGDLELRAGRSPVPMMDRRCQDQLPACQVGFLTSICQPCYKILSQLFPHTTPMLEMVNANVEVWKQRAERAKKKEDE